MWSRCAGPDRTRGLRSPFRRSTAPRAGRSENAGPQGGHCAMLRRYAALAITSETGSSASDSPVTMVPHSSMNHPAENPGPLVLDVSVAERGYAPWAAA